MDRLPPPPGLNLTGNLAENWRIFEQQYDVYVVASGVASKADKVRGKTLLHVLGPDDIDVYNTFAWTENEDKTKVADIKKKFKEYCNPRKNVTYETQFQHENTERGRTRGCICH